MAKLKVYRTAIGFHDAYVAAPSMKAALAAWGADANLFARGQAEIVTEQALTAEPLAKPGEVVKRARGTAAEHFAALGPVPERQPAPDVEPPASRGKASAKAVKSPKALPRPSRAKLDAAEAALRRAEERQAEERAALAAREAALREERRRMDAGHRAERQRLSEARRAADAAYSEALRRWRDTH